MNPVERRRWQAIGVDPAWAAVTPEVVAVAGSEVEEAAAEDEAEVVDEAEVADAK